MPIRAHIRLIGAALCSMWACGCGSVPIAPPAASPAIGVRASDVYAEGTTSWASDSGVRATRTEAAASPSGEVTAEIRDADGLVRSLGLVRDADGAVRMRTLTEPRGSGTRTLVFTPPLLVMPAVITDPGTDESEVTEIAGDLGQGVETVRTGSATSAITLTEPFVDVMEADAVGVRREIRIDIGPARVLRVTDLVVRPGLGVVRERSVRAVRVFGITVDQDVETWTRVE